MQSSVPCNSSVLQESMCERVTSGGELKEVIDQIRDSMHVNISQCHRLYLFTSQPLQFDNRTKQWRSANTRPTSWRGGSGGASQYWKYFCYLRAALF